MAGQFGGYITPLTVPTDAGSVTSGDVGPDTVVSGSVGSGAVMGQPGGGSFNIASGTVGSFELSSGAVVSGRIASGQVGNNHLALNSVISGRIASGVVSTYEVSSGLVGRATQFGTPFHSGTAWSLVTEEIVSGVRAVCISQSGNIRVAMASVSGRMPAIGVVVDNVLSGIAANVYVFGAFQTTSGLTDYSGYLGKTVWVGRSGQLVTTSGSFNSGGFNNSSGQDFVQRIGFAHNSGGFCLNISPVTAQVGTTVGNVFIEGINAGLGF